MDNEVLLVSGDFVKTGGMDLGNYQLANFLARKGVAVNVIAHTLDSKLAADPNINWQKVSRPYGIHLVGERLLRIRANEFIKKRGQRVGTRVMANGGNWTFPGVNWVHYVHGAAQPFKGSNILRTVKNEWAHSVAKQDEKRAFQKARLLIANSNLTKGHIIQNYGVSESKIHTVYYGCDKEQFFPLSAAKRQSLREKVGLPKDKFLIAFVGALGDERKGFPTLFEAWKGIQPEKRRDLELVVVGRGSSLEMWKDRAAAIHGNSGIRFMGFRHDVPEILQASDAFVLPTRYEAFGLAIQEAIYCGLPQITNHAAGAVERIPADCKELLLHDPSNSEELREKLLLLVNEYSRHLKKALQLAEWISSYTWDDMASKIAGFLEN